jgi:serine/threonine protein kinase
MATCPQTPPPRSELLSERLVHWQERRRQGRPASAEELCADCPELIDELRQQIRALESMEALLGLGEGTTAEAAPAAADPAPGHPCLPGYEILEVLGQGGMGVVYQARQTQLDRLVALKMILAGPCARLEQRARFRAEAEAAARLRHPNVVQIYDVGEHDGQPYFSMEYVDGGSLAQKLAGSLLPTRQAAELAATLADAVHAAHQHGIIHRDLKPANILLQKNSPQRHKEHKEEDKENYSSVPSSCSLCLCGEFFLPKITDFGLARRLDDNAAGPTQTGAILGTPSYLAPEQAEGKTRTVGPAVDVYALGAILYEMLAGRPPFQGESTLETLEQVRTREPIPPSRLRPRVPRDLETICLKCLEKEPHRRYAGADELAGDLRRFLAGEPIRARPTPGWERAVKWTRRKPAVAGLLAVSAAAAASFLGLWFDFTLRLRAERNHALAMEQEARTNLALADQQRRLAEEQRLLAETQRNRAEEQRQRAESILYACTATIEAHAQATERGKSEMRRDGDAGSLLFCLACSYAQAAEACRRNTWLLADDRRQLAEQYADSAIRLLEKAKAAKYFDSEAHRNRLKTDKELEPVRSHPGFQKLLAEVGRSRKAGPEQRTQTELKIYVCPSGQVASTGTE